MHVLTWTSPLPSVSRQRADGRAPVKRAFLALVLCTACRGAQPVPAPAPTGDFSGLMEGRVLPFTGTAAYARCRDEIHLFLLTTTLPRTSLTLHPMGFPFRGQHPLLPSRGIESFRLLSAPDSVPGPFLLAVEDPPRPLVYADSGTVRMTEASDGLLRGHIDAWIDRRQVSTFFTARRDSSLERTLTDGTRCAH